jgi:MarR-like DNA-binding transcriptional regulator SgrR of sgrS sRNA
MERPRLTGAIDTFYQLNEIFDLLKCSAVRTLRTLEKPESRQWLKWSVSFMTIR